MADYSELEMVQMLNSRNPIFFPVIHGRLFREFFVTCRKMNVPSMDSEEIVNDIFVKLYTDFRGKSFGSWLEFTGYLYKAVRNNSINYHRTNRVAKRRAEAFLRDTGRDDDMLDMVELKFREIVWASNSAKLSRIFASTSVRCMVILRRIYYEGKTFSEIAGEMGISEQTVRNHKTIGLKKMARMLRRENFLLHVVLVVMYMAAMV
jgi:RNA polymerase sigma factor (sigma-70 family)